MVGISLDFPSGLRPLMLRLLCVTVTVRHMSRPLQFCFPFNAHWFFLTFFAAEHPSSRGQSIRITVVCSGSSMASFLTPTWLRCSHGIGAIPTFYLWGTGSVCLKYRDMAELWGNLVISFPSALERGPFFVHTVRTVQFYCYLCINIAKAQRIMMSLKFILDRNDQKYTFCLRKFTA